MVQLARLCPHLLVREKEDRMAKVRLELSERQVTDLVEQLSEEAKQELCYALAVELGELEEIPDDVDLEDIWEDEDFWDDDEEWLMDRRQLLAAETYSYSYANYAAHLGGNVRFDELMPAGVDTLELAEEEDWDDARLAQALGVPEHRVDDWREAYRRAVDIIDAPTHAEAFRRGVRYSILDAVEKGLSDADAIERLVTQVCYRAADLAYLLDLTAEYLSTYSKELRQTSAADVEPFDPEDLAGL